MRIQVLDEYLNEKDVNVGLGKWEIQYNNQ